MAAKILTNAHDRLAKQMKFVLTAKAVLNATVRMVFSDMMRKKSVKT